MTVKIGKISRVASPIGGLASLNNIGTGIAGLFKQGIHLCGGVQIMGKSHPSETVSFRFYAGIVSKVIMAEQA